MATTVVNTNTGMNTFVYNAFMVSSAATETHPLFERFTDLKDFKLIPTFFSLKIFKETSLFKKKEELTDRC